MKKYILICSLIAALFATVLYSTSGDIQKLVFHPAGNYISAFIRGGETVNIGKPVAAAVYGSSISTTLVTGTPTYLYFPNTIHDTNGGMTIGTDHDADALTNATYYTIKASGLYAMSACYGLNDTTNFGGTEAINIGFVIDGGASSALSYRRPSSGEDYPPHCSNHEVFLNVGQTVQVRVQQSSGAPLAVLNNNDTRFYIHGIGGVF